MKCYKFLVNIIISLFILGFVKADDEESSTEAVEITLTPGPITSNYSSKDLNASYDDSSVSIQCSGTTCTGVGEGISINEGNVTISAAGTYILQGDLQGQVYISATKDDFIHLVLNAMTISSNSGPAIYETKCDKLVITTVGENSLIDSENYIVDEDEEPNACLYAKSDLTFNGEGSLTVTGNFDEGIRCKKDLKFISGTINVNSKEKGIKTKNSISIKEAIINVESGDSAIKVTKDDDPEKGFIVIDGGKVTVKAGNDGIHAETHLTINGGYIDVTQSQEGLEGQMIDILGGEIYVNASDDGINASKIGAVNDQFGPGGPGNMNGFNRTMGKMPGDNNMGGNPPQNPEMTTIVPIPEEQGIETTINEQTSTVQSIETETYAENFTTEIITTSKTIPTIIPDQQTETYAENFTTEIITTSKTIPTIIPGQQKNNNFGQNNNNNIFGQPNNNYGSQNNNNFGPQNNNNFGSQNNNNFGQNNNNFGPQNNNNFEQNNNNFGPQNNNNFGQNNNNFGQNNNNNFGQNNNNNFGQNNNNFGQNNNNFGQNNNNFGQNNNNFGSQNNNNFGQNNNNFNQNKNNNNTKTTKTIPNNIPTITPVSNAFGNYNQNIKGNNYGQKNNNFNSNINSQKNNNFNYDINNKNNKNYTTKNRTTKTVYITSTIRKNNSKSTSISSKIPTYNNNNQYNNNYYNINNNKNRFYKRNTENDEQVYIKIVGGKVNVKVDGGDVDGIDSNGSLYIGGDAEVYVSNGSGDIYGNMAALDAEGTNVVDNGATIVVTASGMSGMGGPGHGNQKDKPNDMPQVSDDALINGNNNSTDSFQQFPQPPQFDESMKNSNHTEFRDGPMGGNGGPGGNETGSVKQANIQVTVNTQEADTEIIVKDSNDNVIISHKPNTKFSKILISTPKLIEGSTYTIIAGSETQTVTATVDSS
ncbi:hypothetical protein PIROE2DRAFT_15815 [Piromyces sp. E2]|nr:hypothetical protein PIROE2DRAFT_15815 [Piromyces sp. E2]|eukprot:OUM58823.1 hypothetical protein PIROE2DRAFT_15815 [Piromyces sp. E2]